MLPALEAMLPRSGLDERECFFRRAVHSDEVYRNMRTFPGKADRDVATDALGSTRYKHILPGQARRNRNWTISQQHDLRHAAPMVSKALLPTVPQSRWAVARASLQPRRGQRADSVNA